MHKVAFKGKSLLLLVLTALCWGSSFLFIKIAIKEIPPITLLFLTLVCGSIFLYLICRFQNQKIWEWRRFWRHFSVMGMTLNVIPFFLTNTGELYIPSSLAGILNSLTLIFTAILAHYFGFHDRLTKNKIIGIIIGLIGLGIIYIPLLVHENIKNALGALFIIGACLSYGIGNIYAEKHLHKFPDIVALSSQFIIAAIIVLPFSLGIDHPFHLPFPSYKAILGVLGLGVIGTAAGFFFYFKQIQLTGATYASLALLLVPLVAMSLGALFLHERLQWNLYLGMVFIMAGILAIKVRSISK